VTFSYKHCLFLWAIEPAADVVRMRWFPFIHSWTYAEHSITILLPRTTRHIALFLCPYTSSRGRNGANDRQTDTEMWWPWANIRWGHMVCKKTTWMAESSVATFTVLYRTSPILLTFNILRFLYEYPVFWLMTDYDDCILVHKTTKFVQIVYKCSILTP
jgi:hypothetical protein